MKNILLFIFFLFLLISCNFPRLVKQDNNNYKIIDWEGGQFYYVTYQWKGGKFNDAIVIIEDLIKLTKERGQGEFALGRFPADKEWQLGFIAKAPFDKKEFNGYSVDSIEIPKGKYASLLAKGHPENIFIFWKKLKKWLEKDGYETKSPVFEIYKKAFDESVDVTERIGEIRYQITE